MSNMSYCRFRNTETDLRDCFIALDEREELSMDEERAARRMIDMIVERLIDYGVIEDDIDYDAIDDLFIRGDSDQYSA